MLPIFGYNNHFVSKEICRVTNSKWSHCGLLKNGYVIESMGPPSREWLSHSLLGTKYTRQYGVVRTPLHEFKARYIETDIRYLEGDDSIAEDRLGMPFDMLGLICAYLHIDWHDKAKDFCVETVSYCATHIENHEAHRQTPGSIWNMSSPLQTS